jgi:hypothetical protein
VLAIEFSKILGSARKKSMERPCQCQLFPFRFERPKDPMTFLANEQTRMSSSQSSPDDLTRPRVGVFLSRAIDPPFLPCVSKVRQIYRPALLPAWKGFWKEEVLRLRHMSCVCIGNVVSAGTLSWGFAEVHTFPYARRISDSGWLPHHSAESDTYLSV